MAADDGPIAGAAAPRGVSRLRPAGIAPRVEDHRHAILIVEDDAAAREGMRELLEMEGHGVVAVDSVDDGLAALRANAAYCLIILDYHLPLRDGADFRMAQTLNPDWRRIPTVLVTGDAQRRELALRLGLAHVLQKPVRIGDLLRLVTEHCPLEEAAAGSRRR